MPKHRVLVTGSTGFIGRNLAEGLRRTHDVLAPTRRDLDLLDQDSVRRWMTAHPVDVIVHAANPTAHRGVVDRAGIADRTLRMFFHLAEARPPGARFLFLGSGAAYDRAHDTPRKREDQLGEHVPTDEYGFAKYALGRLVEKSADFYDLRLFGVFGPYEEWRVRFVSNAICRALTGRPVVLGQNRRFDYLWVHDLVPVVEHFLTATPRHKAYNVTPDESVELLGIAHLVADVVGEARGRRPDVVVRDHGMASEYSGDNRRLREEIPSLAFTPMRAAVEELTRWYAENLDTIDENDLDTPQIPQEARLRP